MNTSQYYEDFYYAGQVRGRGLTEPKQLEIAFQQAALNFDENLCGYMNIDRSKLAIDLGCGYGNFLYYLKTLGFINTIGADLSKDQVELARSLSLDARQISAMEILRNEERPSLVSALDLIEHLDKNSAVKLLQLVYDRLDSNGMFIIQCPCADGFTGNHDICNDLTHQWGASSTMLRQLLYTAGFTKVIILDTSIPSFPKTLKRIVRIKIFIFVRKILAIVLKAAGLGVPRIWSNSMLAIAWK